MLKLMLWKNFPIVDFSPSHSDLTVHKAADHNIRTHTLICPIRTKYLFDSWFRLRLLFLFRSRVQIESHVQKWYDHKVLSSDNITFEHFCCIRTRNKTRTRINTVVIYAVRQGTRIMTPDQTPNIISLDTSMIRPTEKKRGQPGHTSLIHVPDHYT